MKSEGLTKNTFYNVIKSCSQIIFPLITFPYISRVLQTENVGKVNFGNSVVSYFTLIASLGIYTYAVREGSKAKKEEGELSRIAGQLISINLVTTLLSYLLLMAVLLCAKPLKSYRALIIVQSMPIIFTTLGADWLNTVMGDFKYIAARTVLFQALSLIAMFLFVKGPEDYLVYAVICVLASSGAEAANIIYRRKYCKVPLTLHMDMKRHLPHILLMFAAVLSQTLYCNSDITMLGLFKGDYEVGLYSTSVKIYNIIKTILISVIWVVMPELSYCFSRKDYTGINNLLKYALDFIVVLGLPCIVGINTITAEIIEIAAGKEYLGATASLHILSAAIAFSLLASFIGNAVLLPSGQEKKFLKACFMGACINVVANYLLIPHFGLNAAAFTTALSEFAVFIISVLNIDKRINFGIGKGMLLAPVLGGIGIIIVSIVCSVWVQDMWIRTIATIGLGVLLYAAILILLGNEFALDLIRILKKRRSTK